MYPIVSTISFCIRAWLCYKTIDNIPILENPILNMILLEVIPLYIILKAMSRKVVGVFYDEGEAPTIGAIAYFIVYIVILGIVYLLMQLMTALNILPI